MRHRQTTGAGSSGARPSITVLLLTAAGGGLAAGLDQPAGVWAGYGTVSVAALIGCGALWQQRGLLERRAKEMARLRRADVAESAAAEQRQRAEVDRLRAELEHEQQYSTLIQDQLARAREQVDRERSARRAAERELDALTGDGSWKPGTGASSVLLTVEEPGAGRAQERDAGSDERAVSGIQTGTTAQPSATRPLAGMSAALRRGWQVVDGEADREDGDEGGAETDRIYRPFLDQLSAAAVPVSDAALAMAPVIGAADLDGVLDLTAYDETVEFSLHELNKGMA